MPSSASAFALASSLRARGDEELVDLIRFREIRESGVNDFFDLAGRLLDPASVQTALTRTDRRTLLALGVICELGAGGAVVPLADVTRRIREIDHPRAIALPTTLEWRAQRLFDHGLIVTEPGGYIALDAVCEQLASWPSKNLPSLEELAQPVPELLGEQGKIDQYATDAVAAERAFATSMAVVELIAELDREGVRELARGGFGGPDLKRLAAATGMGVDDVPVLIGMTQKAGLLLSVDGRWCPAPLSQEWSLEPLADRWARIAGAWLDSMDADARFILADRPNAVWGERFEDFIRWMFPVADPARRAAVDDQIAAGELLGITANYSPSTAGSALLARGRDAGRAAMAELLPPEIESVYLQHDLSIVSPGPLAPLLDARLRLLSTVESRALASTFRISAASITRALAAGETEESIVEFLEGISLTGIPQPIRYLVAETAGRYAMLRVGKVARPDAARQSYVHTEDDQLLETLLVDRRLSPLGLRKSDEDGVATSRFDRDALYLALIDARYPAAAVDADGTIVVVEHRPLPRDPVGSGAKKTRDPATTIVERIRSSATATSVEGESAWLERQLELAIKSKLSVTLSVTMPDGTLQDYVLEPTGMSSGRLRARDRKADIERTLPLSRIAMIGGEAAR